MQDTRQLEIRLATSDEQRADVFRFRHRLLVQGAGQKYQHSDSSDGMLRDPVDKAATPICLVKGDRIVAALRTIVTPALSLPVYIKERFELAPFLALENLTVSYTDYLLVDTDQVDPRAGNILMSAAYRMACNQGSAFDFTHASAGEVAMFERLGYRRYAGNYTDMDLGPRVPLVLVAGDTAHLQRVKSPFVKLVDASAHDPQPVSWFHRAHAEVCDQAQPAAMSDDELWSFLTKRLDQRPHIGIPLLFSLSYEEALGFLKLATVLNFKKDEPIMRTGEMGNEMFVILDGSVRVERGGERLAAFAKGGIFGEMAYLNAEPRSADVFAREDTEVLILTQDVMQKSMEKMPAVAARILFNLSLILTERLKDTSQKLVQSSAPKAATDRATAA